MSIVLFAWQSIGGTFPNHIWNTLMIFWLLCRSNCLSLVALSYARMAFFAWCSLRWECPWSGTSAISPLVTPQTCIALVQPSSPVPYQSRRLPRDLRHFLLLGGTLRRFRNNTFHSKCTDLWFTSRATRSLFWTVILARTVLWHVCGRRLASWQSPSDSI